MGHEVLCHMFCVFIKYDVTSVLYNTSHYSILAQHIKRFKTLLDLIVNTWKRVFCQNLKYIQGVHSFVSKIFTIINSEAQDKTKISLGHIGRYLLINIMPNAFKHSLSELGKLAGVKIPFCCQLSWTAL
uniref:Uncharacterized protein n=1 Tax=Cacopsylla melanoneura TaxID=428564 RepID=A0A8D9EXU9_9HEMI